MGKKVLLIRNVAPEKYGGGETYQLALAEHLKKYGIIACIATSSQGLLDEAKERGIETIRAPYIKQQNWSGWRNILLPVYYIKIMILRRWYKKIFKQFEPDAVNIQSRDDWIAATEVAKKMGIKVLWTDHADFMSWVLTNVNVRYKNWIGKWVLRCAKKADKIIMISDFERKSFEKIVFPRKYKNVVTIKNGVKDEYEKYRKIKSKENTICYVGRIVEYKGIGELIEAFGVVNKKYPAVKINIYGDGEDVIRFKKLAEGNNNIRFYGRTDKPLKALAENDIFVLPSYREGLSLSLLDAAMMGKKIIASDVDGNPEVVADEKTGLLVPARNVRKLAEAMLYMIENKEQAEKMAKNVRKYYEEEYDFEEIFREKILPLFS